MKLGAIFLFAAAIALIWFYSHRPNKSNEIAITRSENSSENTLANDKIVSLVDNNKHYLLHLFLIPEQSQITLIPNFTQKENGQSLAISNHCNLAINGGFYQNDDKPLGLFLSDGKIYGQKISGNLVSGFFYQDKFNHREIAFTEPAVRPGTDFILQAGPLFPLPRQKPIAIVDDKFARRMAVGKDGNGSFYFLVIYDRDNLFSGPKLADLPLLFSRSEVQNIANLTLVLNLDGGSASFFYASNGRATFTLSELVPIGSLLCVKE